MGRRAIFPAPLAPKSMGLFGSITVLIKRLAFCQSPDVSSPQIMDMTRGTVSCLPFCLIQFFCICGFLSIYKP